MAPLTRRQLRKSSIAAAFLLEKPAKKSLSPWTWTQIITISVSLLLFLVKWYVALRS